MTSVTTDLEKLNRIADAAIISDRLDHMTVLHTAIKEIEDLRAQVQKAEELLKDVRFALDFLSGGPYEWNPDFKAKIDAYFASKKS